VKNIHAVNGYGWFGVQRLILMYMFLIVN